MLITPFSHVAPARSPPVVISLTVSYLAINTVVSKSPAQPVLASAGIDVV
jgi:hypothetical protein